MSGIRSPLTHTVAAAICLLAASNASAQNLTLEDAVQRGFGYSARLAELEARQAGAAAAEAGRAAAKLPVVAAQAGYTRTNHVDEFIITAPGQPSRVLYPDVPNNYRARIDLQWPIYTGGRADALERAARAEKNAVGEELAAARADLRLEISRAYWALATAREAERVLARSLDNLDAHIADLRTRLEQGLIPPNELLTAQAQRARQRVAALEAANTRTVAEADLRRLTGTTGAEPLVLEPVASAGVLAALEQTVAEERLARAVNRAERRAFDFRLTAARERADAARALFIPQVSVGGGYDVGRPNPRIFPRADRWEDSWDASVNLAWTLWDGGRRAADVAEATAAARAIEARATEFDRQVAFELQARRLDLETALAAIAAADEGVTAALEARRVVGERYRAGVVSATDVLDAELAVLSAELDRTRAQAAARLAEARLRRTAGETP